MADGVRMTVKGVQKAVNANAQVRRRMNRSTAAALKKVNNTIRSRIRRYITASEGVMLKNTIKRVRWYWKSTAGALEHKTRFWIGLGIPITSAESSKLKVKDGPDRVVDLKPQKDRYEKIIASTYKSRMRVELRAQLKRVFPGS